MTSAYRPSNGTEGEIFYERWCAHCERDRLFREDPDQHDGCEILARAYALHVDEPDYPKEWIRIKAVAEDGLPINSGQCTAFLPIGVKEPCPFTRDMLNPTDTP